MNKLYDLYVALQLRAPILSTGGSKEYRGVDRVFYRNSKGDLTMQGSHIKGKLRLAIKDLINLKKIDPNFSLDQKFGKPFEKSFEAGRAELIISDFVIDHPGSLNNTISTRVSIDPTTGTAKERFLQVNECVFAAGALTQWNGHIYFWAEDAKQADEIAKTLKLGLKWIPSLGGIKGSGYGRLEKVITKLESCKQAESPAMENKSNALTLFIEFNDDIFIGGNVNSYNYHESGTIISGSILKGSLARCLNEMCGEKPNKDIDLQNEKVKADFPKLAEYFSTIRFSHAFPCPPQAESRAVAIPFSTIEIDKKDYYDISLMPDDDLNNITKEIRFQIDWKNPSVLNGKFGWQQCDTVNKTRTQIEEQTRTSAEDKLYMFQYISPFVKENPDKQTQTGRVRWIAEINVPDINQDEIIKELTDAMEKSWRFMGKRNSRFQFLIKPGNIKRIQDTCKEGVLKNDKAVVTLQTDALTFNAFKIKILQMDFEDIEKIYSNYWNDISNGSLKLIRFFARQKMVGRYFGKRFKDIHDNRYYPFVLTQAGSVFVLEAIKQKEAEDLLNIWQLTGLPLPSDLLPANTPTKEIWKKCPFVPENGYGEILVNLNWHWEKQYNKI